MGAAVGHRQSVHGAGGAAVPIGRPLPGEGRQEHQPLAPHRDLGGAAVEQGVCVAAARAAQGQQELIPQPFEHQAAVVDGAPHRPQAPGEIIAPQAQIGVLIRHGQHGAQGAAGADGGGHGPLAEHAAAHIGQNAIGGTQAHRQVPGQAQGRRRFGPHALQHLGAGRRGAQPVRLHPHGLQHLGRPLEGVHIQQTHGGCVGNIHHVRAEQAVHQKAFHRPEPVRLLKKPGLLLPHPQQLGRRRHGVGYAAARLPIQGADLGQPPQGLGLGRRPGIRPGDDVAQRPPLPVHRQQ